MEEMINEETVESICKSAIPENITVEPNKETVFSFVCQWVSAKS